MINFETQDIMLLYSLVNMKLRDEFLDLDDLVNYYGVDKKELLDKFDNLEYSKSENEDRIILNYCKGLKDKFFVPFNYEISSIVKWLSGLADADSTVSKNNGNTKKNTNSFNKFRISF